MQDYYARFRQLERSIVLLTVRLTPSMRDAVHDRAMRDYESTQDYCLARLLAGCEANLAERLAKLEAAAAGRRADAELRAAGWTAEQVAEREVAAKLAANLLQT